VATSRCPEPTWVLGYRPSLDGLRCFAIALVLIAHAGVPGGRILGGVGVTVFFTLSGFLITSLLLEERARNGSYSFAGFYRRRAARLTPALVVCVVLAVLLELMLAGRLSDPWQVLAALTYTTNLYVPTLGAWAHSPYDHTWSLAVEEQFYLVWPVLLLAVARLPRRWALTLLVYAVLASTWFRIESYTPGVVGHSYMSLPARADELLIGAGLAIAVHGRRVQPWPAVVVGPTLVAIVAAGVWVPGLLMPTVVALLTVALLRVAASTPSRILDNTAAVWVGRRAYGIYLFNTPILWAVGRFGLPWWIGGTLIVGGSVAVAALSFRWVEQPLLARLRRSGAASSVVGHDEGGPSRPKGGGATVSTGGAGDAAGSRATSPG
jgi:peptidoglycan/LPS O-acetylase OafA/YrhL